MRTRTPPPSLHPLELRRLLSFSTLSADDPSVYTIQSPQPTAVAAAVPTASVVTVLNNGPASNRIDLAVVGDGFTKSQLPTYSADVQNFISGFFNEAPLSTYKSFFNVHQVNVISSVSGVSGDPSQGTIRDTPLSMSFWTNGIQRLLGIDTMTAQSYAKLAPGDDQTVAIANSTTYGGAGYPDDHVMTFAGGNAAAIEIVKHEFGHSFAQLADEYDYGGPAQWPGGEPTEADISTLTSTKMAAQKVKWWRWLGIDGVGTYEGAEYSQFGIYRPTLNSKMRTLGQPYGPVNTEQLIEHMYDIVKPIDSATAAGTYASTKTFSVTPLEPADHSDTVRWFIDNKIISGATGKAFDPAHLSLTPGKHTLSVTVEDPTSAVRDETFRAAHMAESLQWTITVANPPADITPPTARYSAGPAPTSGGTTYRFSMTFSDNVGIKASTIDSSDVLVTGPGGYSQLASLVSKGSLTTNSSPRTATYQIMAPAGSWDADDNGDYSIRLRGSQVSDTAGNFAAASVLGTLNVALPNTITLAGRVFADHNGDGVQESGDAGLAGIVIYIDSNHDGAYESSEPKTTTDANGDYRFTTLGLHSFRVRELLPSGYRIDNPSSAYYDVTLVRGEDMGGKNFADEPSL
jgi:hypothetical protein